MIDFGPIRVRNGHAGSGYVCKGSLIRGGARSETGRVCWKRYQMAGFYLAESGLFRIDLGWVNGW